MIRPYVTVRLIDGLHTPCLIAVTPQGHTQVADTRPGSEDTVEAKRDAVQWAFAANLEYRTHDHAPI